MGRMMNVQAEILKAIGMALMLLGLSMMTNLFLISVENQMLLEDSIRAEKLTKLEKVQP